MPTAREIIDYAETDNAVEMRDALYNAIHDKVMAHLDAQKQRIAQNLISPQETTQEPTGDNA